MYPALISRPTWTETVFLDRLMCLANVSPDGQQIPQPLVCKQIAANNRKLVGCSSSSWTDLAGSTEYFRIFGLSEWDVIFHVLKEVSGLFLFQLVLHLLFDLPEPGHHFGRACSWELPDQLDHLFRNPLHDVL